MTNEVSRAEWATFRARLVSLGVEPDEFAVGALMAAASTAVTQGITMAEFVGVARDSWVLAKQSSDDLAQAEVAPAREEG